MPNMKTNNLLGGKTERVAAPLDDIGFYRAILYLINLQFSLKSEFSN